MSRSHEVSAGPAGSRADEARIHLLRGAFAAASGEVADDPSREDERNCDDDKTGNQHEQFLSLPQC